MRRYEIRTWDFALPTPVGLGELMAYFMIYGDESGKLAKSPYVSFCGYVGHVSEWERVSMEWNNLRLSWGVPPIHMRCIKDPERPRCESWLEVKNKWGKDWENKRDAMLRDFGLIVRNSSTVCVGAAVDAEYFRNMPDSPFKNKMKKNPFYLGLYTLFMESLDKIDRVDKCQSVSLIIDEDPEYGKQIYDLLEALKIGFPRVRERVSAITFARDAEYPGLQMADVVAYESSSWMIQRINNKDAEPSDLLGLFTRLGLHVPKLWDAENLDKVAASGR